MRKYFEITVMTALIISLTISSARYTSEEVDIKEIRQDINRDKHGILSGIAIEQMDIAKEFSGAIKYESIMNQKIESAYIEDKELSYTGLYPKTNEELIKETCEEYLGSIKYTFGMKSTYDGWTIDQGLDCSGFVQFIYEQAGLKTKECLESTLTTYLECEEINYNNLRVGSLGMIEADGTYYTNSHGEKNYTGDFDKDGEKDADSIEHTNHVGIYLGKNELGNDIWCHCNAKDNTVVIGEYPAFKHFYAITILEE